ncbi:hypothetical protein HPB51_021398 [Rhipicephalus microplus]|uniref:Uncharacterized protein n=1 Tax=Rhipicephalus microplus TaxID=6941 RepID=A0A9J6F6A0_RHIMP|nr:hypothetical protein HPB51_021398 [Rhipicephalus microplus]
MTRAFGSARGAQGHNSPPPENVSRRLQFVDSGAEPLEFDAATLRLPTSSLQVTTPPIVDLATECCRRGINDGPGYYPDDLNCAQGHNSPPPENVSRRLQFVDSGAEPLEFDAATLRLPTLSLQVTTPPIVDFATECCRRGINDGPGYYPDDLNYWARSGVCGVTTFAVSTEDLIMTTFISTVAGCATLSTDQLPSAALGCMTKSLAFETTPRVRNEGSDMEFYIASFESLSATCQSSQLRKLVWCRGNYTHSHALPHLFQAVGNLMHVRDNSYSFSFFFVGPVVTSYCTMSLAIFSSPFSTDTFGHGHQDRLRIPS